MEWTKEEILDELKPLINSLLFLNLIKSLALYLTYLTKFVL